MKVLQIIIKKTKVSRVELEGSVLNRTLFGVLADAKLPIARVIGFYSPTEW